jgi:hypothetical protein
MNPHTPKGFHFGNWSLGGFPKLQKTIAGVKHQWLEAFLISLKSSWNVDVYNGFASPIWTSETQVMAKRNARNQIDNLTFDH